VSRRVLLPVALVVLVVVAGCAAAPRSPLRPAGGTATAGEAAGPAAANPWGGPVVVAVEGGRSGDAELVAEAGRYWESVDERHLGFAVDVRVRPDAADPDVVVSFVDVVPDCGNVTDAVGCAPRVTDAGQISRPETVSVARGLRTDSTRLVLKHEFGHLFGLGHDDAPATVMAASSVLYSRPRPNATDRAFPWPDPQFAVHVAVGNRSDAATIRRQVEYALDYYADGAPGAPGNLTFTTVENRSRADVVVVFADESPCGGTAPGSCGVTRGPDPDGDGAVESYARLRVTLVGLDADAVGWHVGYWFAHGLGAEADAEKPPPFRDAGYADRRGRWWT
jgi:hypothetical protein